MDRVTVTEASQVSEARRRAVAVAQAVGFDETAAGRVALVVTELATNVVKYGVPGEILVGTYEDGTGSGVEILALDKGPGFSDLGSALRDGHSTGGSAGEGLGAVRRLADAFDIASRPGAGTAVMARLSGLRPALSDALPTFGAVTVPLRGETANGDAYAMRERADGWTAIVADTGILTFTGIGNVQGAVVSGPVTKRTVSLAGTAGHAARRIQEFEYPMRPDDLFVLCSDGIATGWSLDAVPGIAGAHPTLVAGLIYRDFARARDDATVLVVRGDAA